MVTRHLKNQLLQGIFIQEFVFAVEQQIYVSMQASAVRLIPIKNFLV